MSAPEAEYTKLVSSFYFHYGMLALNSFGLQNALDHSPADIAHFFVRCYSSATACATLVRDELSPRGYMKYAPDSHFVFTSYAVLSLLKVCFYFRPLYATYFHLSFSSYDLSSNLSSTTSEPRALWFKMSQTPWKGSRLIQHIPQPFTAASSALFYPQSRMSTTARMKLRPR